MPKFIVARRITPEQPDRCFVVLDEVTGEVFTTHHTEAQARRVARELNEHSHPSYDASVRTRNGSTSERS